ncbi:hypothetical protein DSL72_006611 [Monilinia vaccinii-corymbosi]|uniref:Uncharacterized protein n=1 Tax=Monilinia vaccinii-corymbosi TaxID=61207 RepID=A0A8A3PMU6_9HELO|nr:hypothetical protein DSL72_006611 [Monilinia vaccinii-corymbosi]
MLQNIPFNPPPPVTLHVLSVMHRFAVLEIEDTDQEIEDETEPQHESAVVWPQKRTSRPSRRYLHSQKQYFIKKPPFLRVPRELRWMIFDELVASISEIEISPSTIDSFHALRLTTKGLREEVKAWAKKRPDIVNDFPYGYYIPSQATFVLKIDHRWKKLVRNKTVSGSHVTFEKSKMQDVDKKTRSIDYVTREQAWYSFCGTRAPQKVAKVGLKFEISLSDAFEPTCFFGSIPHKELFCALSAATWNVGGPWGSVRLYIRGTCFQIIDMEPYIDEFKDFMQATQKAEFDKDTWEGFCYSNWPDEDYDTLNYPVSMIYWEDEKRRVCKRNKAGEDIYEFGGLVMAFDANSPEDMRRGPVESRSVINPSANSLQVEQPESMHLSSRTGSIGILNFFASL